jgi:dTDP-4-amino-4,6-dideoxygalactose transaminase
MIGYGRQLIDAQDIAAVTAALTSDFLTAGPRVEAFEAEIRKVTGAAHAVAVSNGTSALRLLYQVAGIGPGTRVGVPAVTFVATATQASLLGAEIVLLDVDPATLCLTPEILVRCQERLDVVVPVHFAGRLCDLAGLARVCAERGILLLDDAAHAFGSTRGDEQAGDCRHSKGTIHSFHPVKNITTGEGGAITTNDADWAARLRSARHHGIVRGGFTGDLKDAEPGAPWYHEFHVPSTNERISDINCALGISQVAKLERFKAERAEQISRYRAELPSWIAAPPAADGQSPFWHLCSAQADFARIGLTRVEVIARARAAGIALMVHYLPLHHQPVLAQAARASALAGADAAYPRILSLPCYPGLAADDQGKVISFFRSLGA